MNIIHKQINLLKYITGFMLVLIFSFFFLQCNQSSSHSNNHQDNLKDSTKNKISDTIQVKTITYHYDTIRTKGALDSFKQQYTTEQQKIIAAINRIDAWRIRENCSLIIPDTMLPSFTSFSPFPEYLQGVDSVPKLILINQRIQLFTAYENGKMVQFGPVSTGRKSKQTPNKLYFTNFKSKRKVSTVDGDWVMPWYFNISNFGGIGMHEYTLPGYPASHSCIRMYEENAFWIFNWADQWELSEDKTTVVKHGTPVLVFGTYNFDEPSPWKLLPQNPDILQLTTEELNTIKETLNTLSEK